MKNPYATESQRAIEDRALSLLKRPELVRAREIVTMLFKQVITWPERDQVDRFENMYDEYMFHHAFRAANCDPNFPEVGRFMVPAHHWFGRDVPGSRWGGDSPDFIYRTIPIGHGGRYEIHGKPTCAEAPIVFYSLMSDATAAPITQDLLESLDMAFEADGSFVVTVDDTPANGRRNHLQTKPGAEFIFLRDSFGDWLNQGPNDLTVKRLNPSGGRRTEEEMARHAAKIAIEGVYYTYYCFQSGKGQAPNTVRLPQSSGIYGAVATQWGVKGHLDLPEDEAIIIRANAAGALFRNVVLTDVFHMSIEYGQRTSSLNMNQMAPDEDGDFTYVVAHQDPGIHNWLDTGGVKRSILCERWQGFSREPGARSGPYFTTKLVKLDDLAKELPKGVKMIDAAGRKAQIADRKAGFARRFDDQV